MAAELTRQPALEGLTTRRADDPAIALVDAWSQVLDVLTFYSERLANEGFLRTAVDPRSITELAYAVGYAPGRGRAAEALLAFTLEDAIGSPAQVPIPVGTQVASLPGPGQVPQTYETTAKVDARPEWNSIRARSRLPQQLGVGATHVYVDGLRQDLAVGDALLLVGREREGAGASSYWAFRLIAAVDPQPDLAATRLSWTDPLGSPSPGSGRVGDEHVPDPRDARLFVLRRKAGIFGAAAPDYRLIASQAATGIQIVALAEDTAIAVPDTAKDTTGKYSSTDIAGPDWPGWTVRAPGQPENTVDLDAVYPAATKGSWSVFTRVGVTVCYRILDSREVSRTDYTLNSKVSRLSLQGPTVGNLFSSHVRETSAYVGSELVPLATAPVSLPVGGQQLWLEEAVPTLEAGRSVIVRGPRPVIRVAEGVRTLVSSVPNQADVPLHPGDELEVVAATASTTTDAVTWSTTTGTVTSQPGQVDIVPPKDEAVAFSELAVVAAPTPDQQDVDVLTLDGALAGCYDPSAVRVLANVAPASHGETKSQILGSGDSGRPFQHFVLAQQPLTYVAAGSSGAVASTLEVRVDGRRWQEVPRFFGTGADDEIFTTEMDDEGVVTVRFGDGTTGARLPTGTNNVTATYRVGTGLEGKVDADQLTLLMTRPLGVRSVTNPMPAGVAEDRESPDVVKPSAARTALTLDRVVSLRDVEDFARSVEGVGKAQAAWLWDGRARIVHLTVAGVGGQTLDADALKDLEAAIRSAGDARLSLIVQAAEVVLVYVSAGVVVDPAYEPESVISEATAAVTAALSVEARQLGQPLTAGDVILTAHRVPGVLAVNVTLPPSDVASFRARFDSGQASPAQIVALAPGGLNLAEATS
jgi:phage-related protein